MVDPALDDEDPIGGAEVARCGIRGVEDDHLGRAGRVVEREEDHRLAALRRHLLHVGDDPAHGDDLAVAAPLELRERRVGLAPELLTHAGQRMLGDVEAERLLLEAEEVGLLVLARRDHGVVADGDVLGAAGVEQRALPEQTIGGVLLRPGDDHLEELQHPFSRLPLGNVVEGATLDQRLERTLVHELRIDALGEVPDRRERTALRASTDDRLGGRIADVLDRGQAEADLPLDDGEVRHRGVDVGRQDVDAHLVARVDVERHPVLRVHHRRDQRRHVLAGMVGAKPRRAVRDQRVAGRVSLVEGVVLRLLHVLPELVGDCGRDAVLRATGEELPLERRHQLVDLLPDRAPQRLGLRR